MPLDDADIMRRVQAGEVELFDLLVERYRSALWRVAASKLGDPGWAEDVVQETLLAAFTSRGTYDPQFAFRTWLWTILLNLCRRQWQRRQSRGPEQSCSESRVWDVIGMREPWTAESGLTRLLRMERRTQVHQLLRRLPEVEADALRLRFLAELPFAEIALAMNSSLGTAKRRVKLGLLALAEILIDESGDGP
jgi:RNA polymerase sigma-70 factor (ECF subfamily)